MKVAPALWVALVVLTAWPVASSGAQQKPDSDAVELSHPPVEPILMAPLTDRQDSTVLVNEADPEMNGRLLSLDRTATTRSLGRELPALLGKGDAPATPRVPCLLLPDGRSQLVFQLPQSFSEDHGTLELLWQPVTTGEEFGALFCSDTDTAFQAFFAEGALHFRVGGGQVSCVHQPRPGVRHVYRFLWNRLGARRAVWIDGEPAVDERGTEWKHVDPGKELFFNARANLAFPGRGGAPGYYARIALYDTPLEPAAGTDAVSASKEEGENRP